MPANIIKYDTSIGRQKPDNLFHGGKDCPFCDKENLTNIVEVRNDMILLKNKYNVIQGADQLVLIESDCCSIDIPQYSKEKMHNLISFGMEYWEKMLNSYLYQSVVFFKNYGIFSGGTIRHPHMQLIGFPKLNTELIPITREFDGEIIAESNGVILNVSVAPRIGFWELNIIPNNDNAINTIADFIQISVDFFMNKFKARSQSYNIFFYNHHNRKYIKVMPRFATSPIYIGYNIRLLPTNIIEIRDTIKHIYF